MAMYHGASTAVMDDYDDVNHFAFQIGMHQGFSLSPLQFVIILHL